MKSWEEIIEEYEQEQQRQLLLQKEMYEEQKSNISTIGKETAASLGAASAAPKLSEEQIKRMNRKRRRRRISAVISNVIFYGAIALLLFATITAASGDSSGGGILGYRYYHILSSSMNSVYPKGSVVIVKEKGDYEIQIGDDITFYTDPNTTVTHRVIDIIEDYDETGARGYQTQGTENLNPDPDIRHEANVVGKVVYCIPKLGTAMGLMREYMVFIFIMFMVCVLISFLIRLLIQRRRNEKEVNYDNHSG